VSEKQTPRGWLVTFEGGEGSGKTTQARRLHDALAGESVAVRLVREPGGTPTGEAVRTLLLDPEQGPRVDRAELLLYLAARAELVDSVIRPALVAGEVVICDRYVDASVAYQGGGRGLGEARVAELNAFATTDLVPDVTFYLDIDPARGLARAAGRGRPDRIEREPLAFHERVRDAYRRAASADRFVILDGTSDEDTLHADIRAALAARLGRS